MEDEGGKVEEDKRKTSYKTTQQEGTATPSCYCEFTTTNMTTTSKNKQ